MVPGIIWHLIYPSIIGGFEDWVIGRILHWVHMGTSFSGEILYYYAYFITMIY